MSENVVVSKDILQQALAWIHYHRRAYAIDEPIEERNLRSALSQQAVDPVDEYRKGFIEGQIDMRDRPEEQAKEIYTCGWQDAVKTLFTLMHELQQDPVRVHPSYHWLLNYISQHVASPNYPEAIIQRHFERSPYGAKQEQKTA